MRHIEYAFKWLICAVALAMVGCAGANAWVACELGKLPQSVQIIIPDAVAALEQGTTASAIAALEAIGTGLAPGQLECIVEAIAADAQKKAKPTMVANAAAFKAKHPKTCVMK